VKHCAAEKALLGAWTSTVPFGWMNNHPFWALHRSTGAYTGVAGRMLLGSVKATGLVALVLIAPWNRMMPPSFLTAGLRVPNEVAAQPF
jgi:hypothetical protein